MPVDHSSSHEGGAGRAVTSCENAKSPHPACPQGEGNGTPPSLAGRGRGSVGRPNRQVEPTEDEQAGQANPSPLPSEGPRECKTSGPRTSLSTTSGSPPPQPCPEREGGGEPHTADLDRYARATGPWGTRPGRVVRPTSAEEVCQLVRDAQTTGEKLYPISRGRNWGYGDACAPTDGQTIVDLSGMNRIVEVNEELAYCVIEPGVSQGQLADYLAVHHPNLWLDVTGAGRDASIVGNTLDRGFGHTRYGDHFLTACGLQVVMPDGNVLDTGFTGYDQNQAGRVYRYGTGPFLDGLFAQSNLGICTKLGLWLMPKPEAFCAFFFYADRDEQLEQLIDRLAKLRMQGLLQSTIHIGNDLRVISARTRYPYDRAGGRTPLPNDLRRALRKEYGVGAWNGGGAIYGSAAIVNAMRKRLTRELRGFHVQFVDDRKLAIARGVARGLNRLGLGRRLTELLDVVEPVYGLLKGVPSDEPLRGASWRVRDPEPAVPTDPLDTHAGLIWSSPILPNRGSSARAVLELVEPIYARHGFEPLVTFTMITERAMVAVTNIAYDRRDEQQTAAAGVCYDELTDALIESGFIPYRVSPKAAAKLRAAESPYWQTAGKIKRALDPRNIISPGRYLSG